MVNTQSSPYFVAGGTLTGDVPSYVERQADHDLYVALQAGDYCYLLDTRQVGKSSLIVRVARRLSGDGFRTALLDLSTTGAADTEEQWYGNLLFDLARALNMEEEAERFWEQSASLSCAQRWLRALHDLILPRLDAPLVIFIDEIESVRKLTFSTDGFFTVLRALYNQRASEPAAKLLRFCLVGVSTPADLIRDPRTTPFNIGRRIELRDFSLTEMQALGKGLYGTALQRRAQIERIHYWTSGHPYLTQRLCQAVVQQGHPLTTSEVDHVCQEVLLSRKALSEESNLHFVRRQLLEDPDPIELLNRYARLRSGRRVLAESADALTDRLLLAGLARLDTRSTPPRLLLRNRIYARVFDRHWIRTHMPDAERRRQRRAMWAGILRASVIWSIPLVILIIALRNEIVIYKLNIQNKQLKKINIQQDLELQDKNKRVTELDGKLSEDNLRLKDLGSDIQDRTQRLDQLTKSFNEKEQQRSELQAKILQQQKQSALMKGQIASLTPQSSALKSQIRELTDESMKLSKNKDDIIAALRQSTQELSTVERGLAAFRPALQARKPPAEPVVEALRRVEEDGRYRLFHLEHPFRLETAEYSPDEKWIATAGRDHNVWIWDATTGKQIFKFQALSSAESDATIWTAEFSPDGKYLVTLGSDRVARIWVVASLQKPGSLPYRSFPAEKAGSGDPVPLLAHFSPSGHYLAVTGKVRDKPDAPYCATIWEVEAQHKSSTLHHEWPITSIDFNAKASDDGKETYLVLAGANSPYVRVFDFKTGDSVFTYNQEQEGAVSGAIFSYQNDSIYSASVNGKIKTWTWEPKGTHENYYKTYEGHQGTISGMAAALSGNMFVSTGQFDHKTNVWYREFSGSPLYTLESHSAEVKHVSITLSGTRLVTASYDSSADVWLLQRPIYAASDGALNFLALNSDGSLMIAPSSKGRYLIWRTDWKPSKADPAAIGPRSYLKTEQGHPFSGVVFHAVFSPDSTHFATAAAKGDVRLWNVSQDGTQVNWECNLIGHNPADKVNCVAFSPDNRLLASASDDHTVLLWDLGTHLPRLTIRHPEKVFSCVISPDGTQILTGCVDGAMRLYDMNGNLQREMQPPGPRGWQPQHYPWSVAFSEDGRLLLTGDSDHNSYLWQRSDGKLLATLPFKQGQVFSAQFSRDGHKVVAVGDGGYAQIWDVEEALKATREGREVVPALYFHTPSSRLFGGQFSKDGEHIFVAGADQVVRRYPATVKALVEEAREILKAGNRPVPN